MKPITLYPTDTIVEVQTVLSHGRDGWLLAGQDRHGHHITFQASASYGRWLEDQLLAEGPFPVLVDHRAVLS